MAVNHSQVLSPQRLKVIQSFVISMVKTMDTQCRVTAKSEKPFWLSEKSLPEIGAASIIKMSGTEVNASIAVLFPRDTFLGVMSSMMHDKFREITPELRDGASEILNISFGVCKIDLNNHGYGIVKALPTIVRGEHLAENFSGQSVIVVPFGSNFGAFYVEFCFYENSKN